jgi:hypothetical protein
MYFVFFQVGTVPNYGISPIDGSLKDGAFFYKQLVAPVSGAGQA